jgi:SAM-dependent methyltransferase
MSFSSSETLIHLDFPKTIPSQYPFLVQGWIVSVFPIEAAWIPMSKKIPLTLVERPDVMKAFPDYPFVKGFKVRVKTNIFQNNILTIQFHSESGDFFHHWLMHLIHRQDGYYLLKGHGLEIGALHQPAVIPPYRTVEYCDAHSKQEMIEHFPELNIESLVEVDYIADLDVEGLSPFEDERFDFVILNHVIEHVANPIKVVAELFRITKVGGHVVISAPDKNYTFDKPRALTPFFHLREEYENQVTTITDAHYLDFLQSVRPDLFTQEPEILQKHLEQAKIRREHAHVWDSQSFSEFMQQTIDLLGLNVKCVFISLADFNHFEYFAVWEKSANFNGSF